MAALLTSINPWLTPKQWPDYDQPISLMDRLWNRLDGFYQGKWRTSFSNEVALQNWREAWAEAFEDEKISPQEVVAGLAACRKLYDWPPSLAQFIKACRPPLDYAAAFHEAVIQMRKRDQGLDEWLRPEIYWAATSVGGDLLSWSYVDLDRRWARSLDEAIAGIKSGTLPSTVPPRLDTLPSPGKTIPSVEKRRENIDRLKAVLAGSRLVNDKTIQCTKEKSK